MPENYPNTIAVTVDKSHIVTIGERLYSESVELVRELINNAYDADASEVRLTVAEDQIIVEDNGSGMDIDGLRQYFNIGSTAKRENPLSPKFKRQRIGEFGIGKFASLSACARFEVWTKKGEFQARVIFDKKEWEDSGDRWHLPLEIEEPAQRFRDGTKVTLFGLNKKFDLADIERRIIEAVPIKADNFSVYINARKVNPRMAVGHRIPFLEGTEYGIIHGEIVIAPAAEQDISEAGIECKVKQVTVTRDFFGLEKWVADIARIRGEVNADFLSVTSDRSGFVKDTPQYGKFLEVMRQIVERAKPILDELADRKENRRIRRSLSEVLEKVRTALTLNPDYCPEGWLPVGDAQSDTGQPGYVSVQKDAADSDEAAGAGGEKEPKPQRKRRRKPAVKRLSTTAVIKKLKMGQQGVSCCVDHLGPEEPECISEGSIIYINRDHPLYQKEAQKKDTYILHIARLLTQEICLMKDPRNPRQAFARQSKLLKDALVEQGTVGQPVSRK